MYQDLKHHLPRIGMRIVKSALAAGIAVLIYYLLGFDRLPFFIVIAALQCMQHYNREIKTAVLNNIVGLFIGTLWALIVIILQQLLMTQQGMGTAWSALFIALGVGGSLYTAVITGNGSTANFSAVIFLCIVGVHVQDEGPFLYVAQRFAETLVGVGIGTIINIVHLPRRKITDTLFAVSMDEVLHSEFTLLPEYSKVEVNRIIDEGINLTLMTRHSATSLLESGAGINFRLPVILMDGAAIYDSKEDRYLDIVEIEHAEAVEMNKVLQDLDLSVYTSALIDDTTMIFYENVLPDSREMFERLRRSPYRNYVHRALPEGINAVHLTAIGSKDKIDKAYQSLLDRDFHHRFKLIRYDFEEKVPYAYMRVLSKDADRHCSLERLKELTGFEHCLSFGSDPETYDVCINAKEGESILKALRRHAEPLIWQKKLP